MPRRVLAAVALLWIAWAISACTLAVRVFIFGLGPAWSGFAGIAAQALLIYFIGKRSNLARIILLILVVITLAASSLLADALAQSSLSAIPTIVAGALRVVGLALLFSGASRPWFRPHPAAQLPP